MFDYEFGLSPDVSTMDIINDRVKIIKELAKKDINIHYSNNGMSCLNITKDWKIIYDCLLKIEDRR